MEKKVLISAQSQSMPWIAEVKELAKKGFMICIDRMGVANDIVSVKAVHEVYGEVQVGLWNSCDFPIRWNWMEKVS